MAYPENQNKKVVEVNFITGRFKTYSRKICNVAAPTRPVPLVVQVSNRSTVLHTLTPSHLHTHSCSVGPSLPVWKLQSGTQTNCRWGSAQAGWCMTCSTTRVFCLWCNLAAQHLVLTAPARKHKPDSVQTALNDTVPRAKQARSTSSVHVCSVHSLSV